MFDYKKEKKKVEQVYGQNVDFAKKGHACKKCKLHKSHDRHCVDCNCC